MSERICMTLQMKWISREIAIVQLLLFIHLDIIIYLKFCFRKGMTNLFSEESYFFLTFSINNKKENAKLNEEEKFFGSRTSSGGK